MERRGKQSHYSDLQLINGERKRYEAVPDSRMQRCNVEHLDFLRVAITPSWQIRLA